MVVRIIGLVVAPALAVLAVPVLIGGPGPGGCGDVGGLAPILATIRAVESGGDYNAQASGSTASGAYQFTDGTWGGYDGYATARLAPPEVQDAKAAGEVQRILARWNEVGAVPVAWYWPRALTHPEDLDIVPVPGAGNRLTVREYQTHWLAEYQRQLGAPGTPSTPTTTLPPSSTVPGSTSPVNAAACAGEVSADGYALPLPRDVIAASPKMLGQPHHDYPAIDLLVPEETPVFAVRGGKVARIVEWPYNCYRYGRCLETCGVGLSIDGDDGARWAYCHGTRLNGIQAGDTVTAGQLIMFSGDTGRSGAPHLHVEVKVGGVRRCPQALLTALWDSASVPAPGSWPTAGCSF